MKNNVEIPFELLKELYENTTNDTKGKIEAYVPEVITKFKNGDWVKSKYGSLICITDIDNGIGYGFEDSTWICMEWRNEGDNTWSFGMAESTAWSLADMEEVQSALIHESHKRGFYYGESFRALDDKDNSSMTGGDPNDARVGSVSPLFENGVLYCRGFGQWAMFKDGLWAQPYKRDEIEKEIEYHKEQIEKLKLKLNNHN